MNTQDVQISEGTPVSRDKTDDFYVLAYDKEVAGLKAFTEFTFYKNELGKGTYNIKTQHTNHNDYIYDFDKLRKELIKKYGAPRENDPQVWSNTTYKNNQDKYGLAVGMGHLNYVANWETENSKIILKLKGENLSFKLTVTYTSKKYDRAIEKLTDEKSSEGL